MRRPATVASADPRRPAAPATSAPVALAPSRARTADRSRHRCSPPSGRSSRLALLLHLAYGAWSVRRIVPVRARSTTPTWQTPLYEIADRLELDAAPRLLRSDDVKMPFAAGLLASTIVLPAESDEWSAERRTRRADPRAGPRAPARPDRPHRSAASPAPSTGSIRSCGPPPARLRAESERACDDLALVFGARPSDYAEHLLDIVTCVRDHNTPAVALAMAHRKEFEGRMLAILNPELRRRGLGRLQSAALVGGPHGARARPGRCRSGATRCRACRAGAGDGLDDDLDTSRAADGSTWPPRPKQPPRPPPPRPPLRRHGQRLASINPSGYTRRFGLPRARGPIPVLAPGSQRAEVLAKMLRGDSSASVRRIAAWGLHNYGDVRVAVDALIAAVTGDADTDVREMAAWSLAEAERQFGRRRGAGEGVASGQERPGTRRPPPGHWARWATRARSTRSPPC